MINDGLTVSLVGMGVVFAVLALLALSIKGISLLDREPSAPEQSDAVPVTTAAPEQTAEITGQQVAAIAVALALSEPKPPSIPASISQAGTAAGSWLQSGRMRVLGSSSTGARERRK
ncbi:MAG: OadG family protein [Dehalococcoidia bacterium]|nr:OadG family protein [Dehalococcoidia bacterium]MDP7484668.1 OadG family protein [Dehalococcoidia bacterium]